MSSGYELFIDTVNGAQHAAVVHKTVLHNLYVDTPGRQATWASVYMARVVKIDKKLNAAILDLGNGLMGLLNAKNALTADGKPPAAEDITLCVSPGQSVMAQVKSEGRGYSANENQKMPRMTMKIHVMGQYMHHTPLAPRILNPDISDIADWLADKGGWVIRRTARNIGLDKLKHEAHYLLREWSRLSEAAAQSPLPRQIKPGPTAFEAVLGDYASDLFDHIHVGDKTLLEQIQLWCQNHDPTLAESKRLRLFKPEKPRQRLFDIYDLYGEIDCLAETRVDLREGGSIIIENTAAMVVIDVNQGASQDSLLGVNMRAADEIMRQLRLRNLGGMIMVDFINLTQKSERLQLFNRLEDLATRDPIVTQVHGYSRLGIIEITRKRRTPGYDEKLPNIKKAAAAAFSG